MGEIRISRITRLLASIIPVPGLSGENGRRLKSIEKKLKKDHSELYSPRSGKLGSAFAGSLEILRQNLEHIKPVLEATVGCDEPYQLIKFQRELLNRILFSSKINLEMLDFNSIQEEISQIKGKGDEECETVFKVRFAAFTSLKTGMINSNYLLLYRLWLLSSFDFTKLLKKFTKNKEADSNHIFRNYDGTKIVEQLKDLYYLCEGLEPDREGLKMLKLIASISKEMVTDEKFLTCYAGLQEFLSKAGPSGVLGDIIKSVCMNPDVELKVNDPEITFVQDIQASILKNFKSSAEAHKKEIAEKAFRSNIKQIFEDHHLEKIDGYSIEVDKLLTSNSLPGLRHITALRLLKTFASVFYETHIKVVYRELLDKVDYVSPDDETELRNGLSACDEISSGISKFEQDLGDRQFSKLIPVVEACTKSVIANSNIKNFRRAVEGTNSLAVRIVEAGTSSLQTILQGGLDTIEDVKAQDSLKIINSRYLRDNETELLERLEKETGRIFQFLMVMKHFSVNREQAKAWRKNLEQPPD